MIRITIAARRFRVDNRGSVAIIFGLALIPLIAMMGAAIDYSMASRIRAKLNDVADAAALAAVAKTAIASTSSQAQSAALSTFNAQSARLSGFTLGNVSATVTDATNNRTAVVTYTASVPTSILGVIGISNISVGSTSTAATSLPIYSDFYLLLDGSPSMGIGATPGDISAIAAVNNGCGFACHSPQAYSGAYPGYNQPVVSGTTLRIDVLRSAVSQLISTAEANQVVSNQYRVGLYTFTNSVTTLTDLTTNLSQAQTTTSSIALPTAEVGTQIGNSVHWLNTEKLKASGSGSSGSPVKFVFLITDGVEDQAFNYVSGPYDNLPSPQGYWNGTPYSGVMLTAACTAIKNKGVTLAVLYTQYDPLNDSRYTSMVQPFAGNIAATLQSCASPNFYFQADHSSDILAAVQSMFAQAIAKSARLTN
jgi:Flp pilus assembly protein TadG